MQLELRHLKVVLAVAEAGSLSEAAVRLRTARPPLVAQLRRIEQEVGGVLFERTSTGVAPTELGHYVLQRCREQVDQFTHLCNSARALLHGARVPSEYPVGVTVASLLPTLLAIVRRELPDATPVARVGTAGEAMVAMLLQGRLKLALVHEWVGFPLATTASVARKALFVEPALVGLPVDHPLADRAEVDLADLAEADWVLPGSDENARNAQFRLACGTAGFRPRVAHLGVDRLARERMVAAGHGVALFSPSATSWEGLVLRPLTGNPCSRRVMLIWPANADIERAVGEIGRQLETERRTVVDDTRLAALVA